MTRARLVLRSLLLLGVLSQVVNSELRLELVQVLLRHGERTPRVAEMYPKDPYNVSIYEPMGIGQLTNKGKATEFRIGQMLRRQYNSFLGKIYRPTDVYAMSTDVDRTKMSLLLTLAGLYPPSASQMWDQNLNWMPIPIHYVPERLDVLMKPHISPVYEQALKETRGSSEVLEKLSEYRDFFKFLSEKTGLDMHDSSEVYEVFNLLTSQRNMNLKMPDWCTEAVYNKIKEVVLLEYDIRSYTTQLKRLNGGMLVKRFIENLNIFGERKNLRKLYLYSGHEVNVAAFVRAHGLTEPGIPDYGCAILFEKLRDENGKLFVRLLHWTGITGKLITYNLPGCDKICPIEKYLSIVRDVIPSAEEESGLWDSITKEEIRKLFVEKINIS